MRIIFVLCILLFALKTDQTYFQAGEELRNLFHLAEESKLKVKHWEVLYKGDLAWELAEKSSTHMEFVKEITEEEKGSYRIYRRIEKLQDPELRIEYDLTLSKETRNSHLTISISSDKILENPEFPLEKILNKKIVRNLPSKMDKYTCLRAENNDIMRKINLAENLSQILNLENQEIYKDKFRKNINVTEIYGYIKGWNEPLLIQEEPINFHLVLLEDQAAREEILIGTPILIHEY